MKRTIFICTMLWLMTYTLYAQTEAGTKLIGGQAQFRAWLSENKDNSDNLYYEFSPYFGYFLKENFTIGGGFSFSNLKIENESTDYEFIDRDISIFVASRYYIPIGETKKFYAYFQGSFQFSWGKIEDNNNSHESEISQYILAIDPGFAYFPSKRWGLELSFSGFDARLADVRGGDTFTRVTLGTDSFSPSLGVSYYF